MRINLVWLTQVPDLGTAQQGAVPTQGGRQAGVQGGSRWGGPAGVSTGGRQQSREGASVPPDLDGRELPEVGLAHVQQAAEGRGAPLERGQLVPRGATGRQEAQGLGQCRVRHLHIDAPVGALVQGLEGVGAVGWVEVGAG